MIVRRASRESGKCCNFRRTTHQRLRAHLDSTTILKRWNHLAQGLRGTSPSRSEQLDMLFWFPLGLPGQDHPTLKGLQPRSTVRNARPARPRSLVPLVQRLQKIKLLLCDVDGVLTNGTVLLGEGKEYKAFNIQDGLGLLLLKRNGIKVGLISNRPSGVTQQRAEELKVDFLHQEKGSKVAFVESLLAQVGLGWDEVCYIGDDVVDLGV